MEKRKLLIVDDEPEIRAYVATIAEDLNYLVYECGNIDQFHRLHEAHSPEVVFLDLVMPGADGIEVLRWLADQNSSASVIVASGLDSKVLEAALRVGETHGLRMLGTLNKPILPEDLETLLEKFSGPEDQITESTLVKAIENREIWVAFQPKIALNAPAHGTVIGVEALARWRHPRLGLVHPAQFIPLAESSGLITPLTDLVFNLALEELVGWKRRGIDIGVSVNLAPLLLGDQLLVDRLARTAAHHGISPQSVTVEVTETAAMNDVARSMATLTRLRLRGFNISMDDFGTGYSSLVELHRMPFTELKIDRSFVMDLKSSQEANVIVRSTVKLGHSLGLSVCAEGVEDHTALAALASMGVECAQGFYMSKPVPANEIPEFIRQWGERHRSPEPGFRIQPLSESISPRVSG